ncbi:MAG: NAD(P)/FAD-dependent oxidoreductase [Treponema sp.]|nr:NAD(P)/FAD-dependent oxidoreductase [Treponema sp.]
MFDVLIIGCGVVGAAAAYELSKYQIRGKALSVAVLDKENDVSQGTSKANSAIIHAGYDPPHGSLMAALNVEGSRLVRELCVKLDIPHRQCGSLVLAFSSGPRETCLSEEQHLRKLFERGERNGVPDMEILSRDAALALEPNLSGDVRAALLAPTAMIISPWEFTLALMETALRNGAELFLNREVISLKRLQGKAGDAETFWRVTTDKDSFDARYVINAAGVYSGKIHNMVSPQSFEIYPYRGEYYLLDKSEGKLVNHIIFQCPTPAGKGVLVAPTVHGNLIAGPNSGSCDDEDDTAVTAAGMEEVAGKAKKSVPSINFRANIRNFAGLRAAADRDDFIIAGAEGAPGFFDAAGIKSPGLSAAPAIAKRLLELLTAGGLALEPKEHPVDTRRRVRFADLSPGDRIKLVQKNPAYGRVLCRCETVTESEILDSLAAPIPPRTLDGVKRRCNPGMGRCQGGFCGPRILELLADRYNLEPEEILQDRSGSYILTAEGTSIGT